MCKVIISTLLVFSFFNKGYFKTGFRILISSNELALVSSINDTIKNTVKIKNVFTPNIHRFFNDTNVVDSLYEFILSDSINKVTLLDGYGFRTKIVKQNDTLYDFYLNTKFPNIKNFLENTNATLKYRLTIHPYTYTIEIDTSFHFLPTIKNSEIKAVIKQFKENSKKDLKDCGNINFKEISELDFLMIQGILSGNKESIKIFLELEKTIVNCFKASRVQEHNYYKRVLIDYGYLKDPYSLRDRPIPYKRSYKHQ